MAISSNQDESLNHYAENRGEKGAKPEKYLKRIVKGAGIALSGSIISQILGAVSGVITTNALGVTHYGIYVLATSWMGLLADYSRLGFGTVIIRFGASYNAAGKKEFIKGTFLYVVKIQLLLSFVLCFCIMIWAEEFCDAVLNEPVAAPYFRFFAPAILLTSLYGSVISFLDGMQNQKYSVLSSAITGNFFNIFSLTLLLWLGYGIYAALGSSLIQDAAILFVGIYFAWKIFPEFLNPNIESKVEKKTIWSFALTMFVASLSYKYSFGLAMPFLGYYRSPLEVGLYAVAINLQQLIFVPANALSVIFNPLIAELYSQDEMHEIHHLYKAVTKWSLICCAPIAIVIILHTNFLLSLFGSSYVDAATTLIILISISFIVNLIGLSGHIINMVGKAKINMINSIITAVITCTMFIFLIPIYSVIGAAIAYGSGLLMNNIIRVGYVFFALKIHPFSFAIIKIILAVVMSLFVGITMQSIIKKPTDVVNVLLITVISLTIYLYAIIVNINNDDKIILSAIRRKIKNNHDVNR
ncbi:MAG: polysaccharide biosynthesis protein [Armatimonadetes bacterium]|nr:polysaccharide biosynthesis protein [Armatimonadota bacterium]